MESRTQSRTQQHTANLADIVVQGAARIVDLQTSTARVLLRAQGRSAALFGGPDWTQMLGQPATDHLSELFMTGAQQALNLMRHTNETLSMVQQQMGQLMEQQTAQVAEQMRQGVEEVSRRTEETLEEFRHTTQQATEEVEQAGEEQEQGRTAKRNGPRGRRRRG